MKTISFALQKGGVGKSSLSMAIAGELAGTYGSTILIDGDPQGNITGQLHPNIEGKELADLLFEMAQGETPDLKNAICKTAYPNLSIIPTAGLDGRLRLYAETLASQKPWAVDELKKVVATWGFKYCIIDTSPSFSPLEKSILLAADEVVTPVMGDVYGIDGLTIFTENLEQLKKDHRAEKPDYLKVIFNAYDKRITSHEKILETLKTQTNWEVFCFPTDPIYRRAQDAGAVIQELTGTKQATQDELKRLAKALY